MFTNFVLLVFGLITTGTVHSQESSNQYSLEHLDNSLGQLLSKKENKNFVISGASIGAAMGMVYLGAKGDTQEQIGRVLGLDPDSQKAKDQLFQLHDVLKDKKSSNITWSLANRILVQKGLKIVDQFESEVKNKLNAAVDNFDFSNPSASAKEVNSWVANKTNNVITKLVGDNDITPESLMVLLNAVYFKGSWKYAFDEKRTNKECFYTKANDCKQTDMMSQKRKFNYVESQELKAQILELPYADPDYSMVILLPFQDSNLQNVHENLKSNSLLNVLSTMSSTTVSVRIPKFEDEFTVNLADNIAELGASKVFTDEANLSGMIVGGGAKVSKVIHKARISVSETGTVAAAATGVQIVTFSLPINEKFFVANRPFLYKIKYKTQFLFSGQKIN